jgi:hypothetical protein
MQTSVAATVMKGGNINLEQNRGWQEKTNTRKRKGFRAKLLMCQVDKRCWRALCDKGYAVGSHNDRRVVCW